MNQRYKYVQKYLLAAAMLCFVKGLQGQSITQNYIQTREPRREIKTESKLNSLTPNKDSVMHTLQYFDGLGRPSQTIEVQGSTIGGDVVHPVAYDQFGREAIKYMPYAISNTTNNGAYRIDALTPGAGVFYYYNPSAGNTNP
ncbi:hypothetical protein ABIB62_004751, partial [Mucilaginibacter sp. UYP25]|uniref:DUF6443 domain-containing protein n=1 Tax=unclassified Mucilaginibacter TaxID=2617802 RepID=UPI003390B220